MNSLFIAYVLSVVFQIFVLFGFYFYIRQVCKFKDRVEDLEKQLNTIVCNLVSYEKYYNSGLNKLHDEIEKINGDFDAHCEYDSFKFNLFEDKISKSCNPFKRFRKW